MLNRLFGALGDETYQVNLQHYRGRYTASLTSVEVGQMFFASDTLDELLSEMVRAVEIGRDEFSEMLERAHD